MKTNTVFGAFVTVGGSNVGSPNGLVVFNPLQIEGFAFLHFLVYDVFHYFACFLHHWRKDWWGLRHPSIIPITRSLLPSFVTVEPVSLSGIK